MAASRYWQSSAGIYGNTSGRRTPGYSRLYISETATDPKNNTSTVKVSYQVKCTISGSGSSNYARYGTVSIDGVSKTLSGTCKLTYNSTWEEKWSGTWTIPHDSDGSKTITIKTSGGQGAGGPSVYLYGTGQMWTSAVGAGTFTLKLTKFDVGTPVYIGGVEYYCYIGNEDGTWSAADPVIG